MIKKCKQCNVDFKTYPCRHAKYCSKDCANLNIKGVFKKGHKWVGKFRVNGRQQLSTGYVSVYSPNHPMKTARNTVMDPGLVMEKKIGRYLKKNEIIHHKNGVKNDNRISNLQLFKNHSEHMKHEYKSGNIKIKHYKNRRG